MNGHGGLVERILEERIHRLLAGREYLQDYRSEIKFEVCGSGVPIFVRHPATTLCQPIIEPSLFVKIFSYSIRIIILKQSNIAYEDGGRIHMEHRKFPDDRSFPIVWLYKSDLKTSHWNTTSLFWEFNSINLISSVGDSVGENWFEERLKFLSICYCWSGWEELNLRPLPPENSRPIGRIIQVLNKNFTTVYSKNKANLLADIGKVRSLKPTADWQSTIKNRCQLFFKQP